MKWITELSTTKKCPECQGDIVVVTKKTEGFDQQDIISEKCKNCHKSFPVSEEKKVRRIVE